MKVRGYTKFFNDELDALICAGLKGGELTVFMHLARMTWGFGRQSVEFSPASLSIGYSTARRAIISLVEYGIINCLENPSGPNPGKYSINPVGKWKKALHLREASLASMGGLPLQPREASLATVGGFSSGVPTPTSDSRPPKENFKESLLKKKQPPQPPGAEDVVDLDFKSPQDKVCLGVIRRITATFGNVSEKYRERIREASAPVMTEPKKWFDKFRDRFHQQIRIVEDAWNNDSAKIKSPIALLVSRLEVEAAQLRKEMEGR